ncbi:MAG: c-type cytochrome [Gammaproteobacteria bacterium]
MPYILLIFMLIPGFCAAQTGAGPGLGMPLATATAARADDIVWPDGRGLPRGHGDVASGRAVYESRCLGCHGRDGRGGPGGELAGGNPDLTAAQPDQTIGTYWPYATTLFDFVRRAMPLDAPWSLSDDEVYAVVAYLLHLNDLLAADARLDARALAALRMPNRAGFVGIDAVVPELEAR